MTPGLLKVQQTKGWEQGKLYQSAEVSPLMDIADYGLGEEGLTC